MGRGSGFRQWFSRVQPTRSKDDKMCSIQVRLAEQHAAAEFAFRSGVARMKETRGQQFVRAWRLVDNRRASLERARQVLRQHVQEHLCGMSESFPAATNGHVQF